ncbi:MAG: hypothetical protein E5V74_01750 [Mesorhizobium sp.]|nr:MAG: hypothetical protein E5V74_01750 [Mesorhizobium sp.]
MSEFFVVSNGRRFIESDLERMKVHIEKTVKLMVGMGSGVQITDASPELHEWLLELQRKYPPKFDWTFPEPGRRR